MSLSDGHNINMESEDPDISEGIITEDSNIHNEKELKKNEEETDEEFRFEPKISRVWSLFGSSGSDSNFSGFNETNDNYDEEKFATYPKTASSKKVRKFAAMRTSAPMLKKPDVSFFVLFFCFRRI